jgi:hypothetical protein
MGVCRDKAIEAAEATIREVRVNPQPTTATPPEVEQASDLYRPERGPKNPQPENRFRPSRPDVPAPRVAHTNAPGSTARGF